MGALDQKLVIDYLSNCVVWWTRWSESERIDYQTAGTECLIRFVIFVLIFWAEVPDLDQSFANFLQRYIFAFCSGEVLVQVQAQTELEK